MDGHWLSIPEYSDYRGKSVSTVRRYIKANQVKYKLEEGKYYIFVSKDNFSVKQNYKEKQEMQLRFKLVELETRIKQLEEENNDLRMLIQIYEQESRASVDAQSIEPPELPNEL